jgi:hypothetical protein
MDWTKGVAVGMPATIHCGSDSYAAEITEIIPFATEAARKRNGRTTRAVVAKYTTGGGLNGRAVKFTLRETKRGTEFYVAGASVYGLTIGQAVDYQDPHF